MASGEEAEFRAVQDRLAGESSTFPGYEGTVLLPPEVGTEWLSMLRFRTPEQLAAWLRSPERDDALPGLRSSLTKGFSAVSQKSAMLVLYPTVMVLSRFLGPMLDRAGAEPRLALWVSQNVSVSALQWWLMPYRVAPLPEVAGPRGRRGAANESVPPRSPW